MLREGVSQWLRWEVNIEPDFEKAEHWYTEALRQGLKVSLFYLGKLYHYAQDFEIHPMS